MYNLSTYCSANCLICATNLAAHLPYFDWFGQTINVLSPKIAGQETIED